MKDWTVEQVMEAQKKSMAEGVPSHRSPVAQWDALLKMDELENQHSKGDRKALLYAIHLCAMTEIVIPEWAAKAFMKAYRQIAWAEAKSWDDVFGKPFGKGAQLGKIRKKQELAVRIGMRARELLSGKNPPPIDPYFFELLAAEFGIKKTVCSELYYGLPEIFRNSRKDKHSR